MQFDQKSMVGWYDVKQLSSTAIKTVVSLVFGNYADKRELQAFAERDVFDFSDQEELWVDYISDLGDGFNPTYTMAHLMAQDQIEADGNTLNRGDILIMGGDEVYPTPEKIEYQNRLQGPYNAAFPWKEKEPDTQKPKLFAIPGNHDWYDGLTNFMRLFCQGRALGNWLTMQKRSYFALKLPYNYWIIGIDIQLKGDIDDPQKTYFKKIARDKFEKGDHIILCTAEPTWTYASLSGNNDADQRLRYFIDHILKGKQEDYYDDKNKDLHISAILSGDLHHYSRYEAENTESGKVTHLITAGGGGAFMHPTHMLKDNIELKNGVSASLVGVFPEKSSSKKLIWKNLAFPFYNWGMCLFLGAFHLLTTWFIQSSTKNPYGNSFMETMSGMEISFANIDNYLHIIFDSIKHSPTVLILNVVLFAGILLFTDTSTGKKKWNYSLGFPHAALQIGNLYFCIWLFARWNITGLGLPVDGIIQILLFSMEMILLGGLISGLFFGIYLLKSSLFFGSHPTEASSSFKHEGYKNFLRIRLTKDTLTIFPIGLKTVTSDWKNTGTIEKPIFSGSPISFDLIEEKPIEIHHTS